MKGTLTPEIFLKRIEHILTYQGYIKGKLYPECFANHLFSKYNRYKQRAIEKEIEFEIFEEYNVKDIIEYITNKLTGEDKKVKF